MCSGVASYPVVENLPNIWRILRNLLQMRLILTSNPEIFYFIPSKSTDLISILRGRPLLTLRGLSEGFYPGCFKQIIKYSI